MKYNRFIAPAVLLLVLGNTLPSFAQKGDEKGGGKAPAAQHQAQPQHTEHPQQPQRAEKAAPQRAEKVAPQRKEKAAPKQAERQQPQRQQQAQHQEQSKGQQPRTVASNGSYRGNGNKGNHYGRISDDHYREHFGQDHSFHMGRPEMTGGYYRFQYGGYSFGYNEAWPIGWNYDDDCYVAFVDGGYYMYNVRHPGIRLTLNIF